MIKPTVYRDDRGYFLESFQRGRYRDLGIGVEFRQDNHSYSKRGVIRGMHFQRGQAKLIYCPVGKIFDVAVDIRKGSKTFGQWKGVVLDDEEQAQFYIPDGFAHGFCVLSEEAHVMYKVSEYYDPMMERGFRFDDPEVGIEWPIDTPFLSERDKFAPRFSEVV